MAEEYMPGISDDAAKIKADRKKLKADQKAQKKEAKKRAKELAAREEELDEDSSGPVIITTLVIIVVWLGIICALVKLDIGGFGSQVLAPVLKNVPVVNKILPDETTGNISVDTEENAVDLAGYSSLEEAVEDIHKLEEELIDYQEELNAKNERILALEEEIKRLETFEDMQVEFERIKTEFYNEVVYAENGPGEEAYQKYYEAMDPATAEVLYKQVVSQIEENAEIEKYAQAYAEMKPKQAAGIFEAMTNDLDLAARILGEMEADARGAILGVMDPEVAAKITKIMEPDS
jgi:flagellar motility protein MotE (MotC chaperone)